MPGGSRRYSGKAVHSAGTYLYATAIAMAVNVRSRMAFVMLKSSNNRMTSRGFCNKNRFPVSSQGIALSHQDGQSASAWNLGCAPLPANAHRLGFCIGGVPTRRKILIWPFPSTLIQKLWLRD